MMPKDFSWLIIIALIFSACGGKTGGNPERMAYIEEQVEERLIEYKRIIDERCMERILEEANRQADSILLVKARLERGDSLSRPPRPDKPDKPEVKTIIDSVPVAPLFKDSLLGSQSDSIQ